ncbi:MAG: hypothetical protein PHT84_01805, partial [Candidatus Pacebacteria bacterium]|nr:hypothetical protein [Candidatus Paceibacterota bacterium]
SEIDRYRTFVNQLSGLINQCYAQTSSASYTGPKTRYGNPWFKQFDRGSYIPAGYVAESIGIQIGESYGTDSGHMRRIYERDFETLLNVW